MLALADTQALQAWLLQEMGRTISGVSLGLHSAGRAVLRWTKGQMRKTLRGVKSSAEEAYRSAAAGLLSLIFGRNDHARSYWNENVLAGLAKKFKGQSLYHFASALALMCKLAGKQGLGLVAQARCLRLDAGWT